VVDGFVLLAVELGARLVGVGVFFTPPHLSPHALVGASLLAMLSVTGLWTLYAFVCEAATGRTIGKRVMHLHVVGRDGARITICQAAVRNVLRVVDLLPFVYVVGQLTMLDSGPERRQRVGDLAARTTVVFDGTQSKPLRTRRWLLKATTAVAIFLASVSIVSIAILLSVAGLPAPPAPVERPLLGSWEVHGTATSATQGSFQVPIHLTTSAKWTVARCQAGTECTYVLTMRLPRGVALSSPLYNEPDVPGEHRKADWSTNFPISPGGCVTVGGHEIPTPAHWTLAITFTANGHQADGTGEEGFTNPNCRYLNQLWNFTATRR
jgi:uncharacterized RDD family membrane protein YckC